MRVSILIKAAGHARAQRIGWGGLRKEGGRGGGIHEPVGGLSVGR